MAYLAYKDCRDWCHLCGGRSQPNVEIWYPENAEHERENVNYIRICAQCGEDIRRVGNREVDHLEVDRPGNSKKSPRRKNTTT